MILVGRVALWDDDAAIIKEVASLGKTYVEIGTLFGGSACIAGLAGCEVFCIDPLDGYYSAKHNYTLRPDPGTGIVATEKIVRDNWEHHGLDPDKLHIYKQLHPPWPTEIDREFDVGFIDGDHSVQGTLDDYLGMGPRVKHLMFHDNNKLSVQVVRAYALSCGEWEEYIPEAGSKTWITVLKRRQS